MPVQCVWSNTIFPITLCEKYFVYLFYNVGQKHESILLHACLLNEFLTTDRSFTGQGVN